MRSSASSTIGIRLASQDQQGQTIAALGYLFTPFVPLTVVFGAQDASPDLQRHAKQALWWSIPFVVMLVVVVYLMVVAIQSSFLMICLLPFVILIPFAPGAIWARRVYLGGDVRIPIISSLVD